MKAVERFTERDIENIKRRAALTCHRKQRNFLLDVARWISLLCGRGTGKTFAAILKLLICLVTGDQRTGRGAMCLYVAKTKEHARAIMWTDLKTVLELAGFELVKDQIRSKWQVKFDETRSECRFINGSVLRLLGFDNRDDIEKPRGLTWHLVVVDEAALAAPDILSHFIKAVLGPRCYQLVLQGTPDKNLTTRFCEVTQPGSDEHVPFDERDKYEADARRHKFSSHHWTIEDALAEDGPWTAPMRALDEIQIDLKANEKWTDASPDWIRERFARWVVDNTTMVYPYRPYLDDGKEWSVWDPARDKLGLATLPPWPKTSWGYGIGFDYGDKHDRFAIAVLAYSYDDPSRTVYHAWEYSGPKPSPKAVAAMLMGPELDHAKYGGVFGALGRMPDVMVGDFAGKGGHFFGILEGEFGLKVTPADKTKGKDNAIAMQGDDLTEGRFRALKTSALAKEYGTLQWQYDMDGKKVENSSQPNNSSDATLYCRVAIGKFLPDWSRADSAAKPIETGSIAGASYPKPKGQGALDIASDDDWEALSDGDGWQGLDEQGALESLR